MAHDWADRDATRRSYELMARYVFPRFQGSLRRAPWSAGTGRPRTGPTFIGAATGAVISAIQSHAEEQAAKKG